LAARRRSTTFSIFSKIEAGKLDLEEIEFSLRESICDALRPLAFRSHAKGLELASRVAPELPDRLIGDPVRLRQIITNLVGNSIKFTEHGEIVVRISAGPRNGDRMQLNCSVSDTGIGIPPDRVEKIFAAFEQADGSTTRRYGGTGLGLSISQRLVSMMGGQIRVKSVLDRGSVFLFSVVVKSVSGSAPPALPSLPAEATTMPILIVDDNATSREILTEQLSSWRMNAVAAEDGARAFGMLLVAAQRGTPYQVAVIDDRMPGMDGEELVQRIADDPRLSCTAVIQLSTDARRKDRDTALPSVVKATVAKPVKQSELLDALMNTMGLASQRERLEKSLASTDLVGQQGLKILLAEDNAVNQKLAVLLLEKRQHRVTVADDGRKAVELFQHETFDVILMDVQMPVMDGLAAVAEIRRLEAASHAHRIPIVAMTAHAMKGDRERCLAAGMDGYVSKPIHPRELYGAIDQLVKRAPRTLPLKQESGLATSSNFANLPSAVGSSAEVPAVPPLEIDWSAALVHTAGDAELMRSMIEVFLTEHPKMISEVETSLTEGDAKKLRRGAHSLKGSCGYFAASDAYEACMKLEKLGESGDLAASRDALVGSALATGSPGTGPPCLLQPGNLTTNSAFPLPPRNMICCRNDISPTHSWRVDSCFSAVRCKGQLSALVRRSLCRSRPSRDCPGSANHPLSSRVPKSDRRSASCAMGLHWWAGELSAFGRASSEEATAVGKRIARTSSRSIAAAGSASSSHIGAASACDRSLRYRK
jgi:two-component system, sensor histidine kinase and response regulator